MSTETQGRRRSDDADFARTEIDVEALAAEIFDRYAGEQPIVVEGSPYRTTFFDRGYCPDFRVMTLAGRLAVAVNRRAKEEQTKAEQARAEQAGAEQGSADPLPPLRVAVEDIMLAALLHDLGKHHEDCASFIDLMRTTDLRGPHAEETAARKAYLLDIVRDVHCRKGPCMIDRLRDAGRAELNNPFIALVARRHGEDYATNRAADQGCWWAREINVVTIADDYDAMISPGPERAYKTTPIDEAQAATLLRVGAAAGRYEPRIADIFLRDVLGTDL